MKNAAAQMIVLIAALFAFGPLNAAEDLSHEDLRTVRTQIIDAITKGDIDTVLTHVHPDVVVTWQNSEVCRGQKGLKDFFDRMGRKSFKGYKIPPTPDELTIFHGADTGISFGKTVATYNLLGQTYEIESRWTATLVKQDDKWLLAAYHISMNTLDNPLLSAAKSGLYIAGSTGLVIGLLIGFVLWRRKKA